MQRTMAELEPEKLIGTRSLDIQQWTISMANKLEEQVNLVALESFSSRSSSSLGQPLVLSDR